MILDLVRLWGLRVPLAWFFAMALKLGSRGVWIGMTASNVVAGLLSLVLLLTVDWRQNVIGHLPRPESLLMGEEAISSVSEVEIDDRP
jgi:Na+-driven multidrug efflux pump